MRRLVFATVAAILLLPLASAAPSPLRVSSIRAVDYHVEGPLSGARLAFDGAFVDGFVLDANRIYGYVHENRHAATINGGSLTPDEPQRIEVDVSGANVRGLETQAGSTILVVPTRATFSGELDLRIPGIESRDLVFEAQSSATQPATTLSSANSIIAEPTSGLITIRGDFDIVVWSNNFTLEGNVSHRIVTGLERQAVTPGVPPLTNGVQSTVGREAYLTIVNGLLTLPVGQFVIYANQLEMSGVSTTSLLALENAIGEIDVLGRELSLDNQALRATGQSEAMVAPHESTIGVLVAGRPNRVEVDGVAVKPAGGPSDWPWWLLFTTAVLAVASIGIYHQRARKNLRVLDALMGHQDFGAAMVVARRLQRFRRYREEGAVAEAICNVKLGDLAQAKRVLTRPSPGRPKGGRLFLQARIAAEQGNRSEAVGFLAACLQQQPGYAADASADPFLGPIVDAAKQRNAANIGGYT